MWRRCLRFQTQQSSCHSLPSGSPIYRPCFDSYMNKALVFQMTFEKGCPVLVFYAGHNTRELQQIPTIILIAPQPQNAASTRLGSGSFASSHGKGEHSNGQAEDLISQKRDGRCPFGFPLNPNLTSGSEVHGENPPPPSAFERMFVCARAVGEQLALPRGVASPLHLGRPCGWRRAA